MKLAIVGATGAVGFEFLNVLEKSSLKISDLKLYASPRSAGKKMKFKGTDLIVEAMPEGKIPADIILASAGGDISKKYAPIWVAGGSIVIDNSSAFRYDDDVPLVVPEVNAKAALSHKGIIANPNCTTAILVVAIYPLHKEFKIKKMIVSTYQAASGAGAEGIEELLEQTKVYFQNQKPGNSVFAHPLPFNIIPHIDVFQENGFTKEEMKVAWETKKIMGDSNLKISCTAVRIPTLRAHSEAVTLELEKPATPERAREILKNSKGVEVVDSPNEKMYPMPLNAANKYNVEVGRIRSSLVFDGGLDLFISGDQLLKGAALNAVQIAELL
jgi:aspartate-semialdehyde dehydrogenase